MRLGRPRAELQDSHGRNRRKIIRKQAAHKNVGQLRKVPVKTLTNLRSKKGNTLQQSRNVWVLDRLIAHPQITGHLGVSLCKLGTLAPQVSQLAIVILEEFITHQAHS